MVVWLSPRPHAWRQCLRRSPGRVERSPRRGSGLQTGPNERPGQGRVEVFPALSHSKRTTPKSATILRPSSFLSLPADELSHSNAPHSNALHSNASHSNTPHSNALRSQGCFVIYRSPSVGRGLGEADVTVRPDWMRLPWVRPFWAGFRPCREACPLHVSGFIKKVLHKDFASESERKVLRLQQQGK